MNKAHNAKILTYSRDPSFLRLRESAPAGIRSTGRGPISYTPSGGLRNIKRALLILVGLGAFFFATYFLASRFVGLSVLVQGGGMSPTLQEGERVVVHRWGNLHPSPRRGDLVAIKGIAPEEYVIRRVIALPCESLNFRGSEILVNGQRLPEPYLQSGIQPVHSDFGGKFLVIGKDRYFVLGDNRIVGAKGPCYGVVPRSQIIGFISTDLKNARLSGSEAKSAP